MTIASCTSIYPYPSHTLFEQEAQAAAAAWFAMRDVAVDAEHPYCLADVADWHRNLILPEVAAYIESQIAAAQDGRRCPFALNRYVNHGLSSQALLFNLVGPLIVRGDLAPLRDAFAGAGVPWPGGKAQAGFEIESRQVFNERRGQPTSLDLVISGAPGTAPLFVEAKFTEKAFGDCSIVLDRCDAANPLDDLDRCYLHRNGYRYWQRMDEYGFLAGSAAAERRCVLANHYQFFREVLFALHYDGHFVLLHDARSPLFLNPGAPPHRQGWLDQLTTFVPEALRPRLHHVSVQQVFAAIVVSGQHDDWIESFAEKYGLEVN